VAEIHVEQRSVKGRQVRDLTKEASSGPEGSTDKIEELEDMILGHMFEHIDGGNEIKFSSRAAQELPSLAALDIPHAQAAGNLQLLGIEVNAPCLRITFILKEIKKASVTASKVQNCCILASGQEMKKTLAQDRRPARE
jgi:hypothetical protein